MLCPMLPFPMMATIVASAVVQAGPTATCHSLDDEPARTWRVEQSPAGWTISHAQANAPGRRVRVVLPAAAEVRLSPTALHVKGRTSNGGIDVTLTGPPAGATLDLYVSYELEVNVDASLTPAIDELNTDGPLRVRCDVTGEAR